MVAVALPAVVLVPVLMMASMMVNIESWCGSGWWMGLDGGDVDDVDDPLIMLVATKMRVAVVVVMIMAIMVVVMMMMMMANHP